MAKNTKGGVLGFPSSMLVQKGIGLARLTPGSNPQNEGGLPRLSLSHTHTQTTPASTALERRGTEGERECGEERRGMPAGDAAAHHSSVPHTPLSAPLFLLECRTQQEEKRPKLPRHHGSGGDGAWHTATGRPTRQRHWIQARASHCSGRGLLALSGSCSMQCLLPNQVPPSQPFSPATHRCQRGHTQPRADAWQKMHLQKLRAHPTLGPRAQGRTQHPASWWNATRWAFLRARSHLVKEV